MTRRIVGLSCDSWFSLPSLSGVSDAHRCRRSWLSLEPPRDPEIDDRFITAAGAVSTAAAQPFGAATTIVNIHSGQPDQKKVVEFYASSVLLKLGTRS
jgi:hypothetical protein